MIRITIPGTEYYDESTHAFGYTEETAIELEHSLASVSLWESKWKVPFLTDKPKTKEQLYDYIRCMVTDQKNISLETLFGLSSDQLSIITTYMNDSMTATTVKHNGGGSRRIITAEVIYSWMVALQIPFECQYWHLNKLMMLIDVCNEAQKPPKKMSKSQTAKQNRSLNRARLAGKH